MGNTKQEFVRAKQKKIQYANCVLFLLQTFALVLTCTIQLLGYAELSFFWFIRLGAVPIFYYLNRSKRYSQGVAIFQLAGFLLFLAKLTAQQYENRYLFMYSYISSNFLILYITYSPRQTIIGLILSCALWMISNTINGELLNAKIVETIAFIVGYGIMLVLASKLKLDEILAFKYHSKLEKINDMQNDSLLFSPDGILVIDQNDQILLSNETVKSAVDGEFDITEDFAAYLKKLRLEDGRPLLEALWNEDVVRLGKTEWISKRRDEHNQLIISTRNVQHFLDDIERQKQLAQIAQQQAELAERERVLEQTELQNHRQLLQQERNHRDFMNQFLRFCSHEFKTPTNGLIAFLDIVRNREDLDSETRELLNIAHVSSKQILYLATNLIDYSCLVAEQFSVNKTEVELADVLAECEFMIQMLARQKKVQFQIQVSPSCPRTIFTDANRLKQILLNLLGNSVKFATEGMIRLCVQPSIADHLNFMVSDTGIGIKQADVSQIFDQFTKLGNGSLNPNGSGFGLHISNLLLKSLGTEKLEVDSNYGKGSKFYFDLPIIAEHAIRRTDEMDLTEESFDELFPDDSSSRMDTVNSELSCPMSPTATAAFTTISEINIGAIQTTDAEHQTKLLIVDDTALNRMVLARIIQQEGDFVIVDASSGQQAIDAILANDQDPVAHPFDLIFMDVDMPGMDGWETTENLLQLKESGNLSQLCPIVAHTAYSSQQDLDHCWQSGMNYILPKPATREDLRVMFAKLLPDNSRVLQLTDRSKS